MKKLRKILLLLAALILLILSAGIILSIVYENEVKAYVVSELNNYLKTEVSVGEIEFSVLAKFPSASLKFNNILLVDAIDRPSTDTLLYAEDLYLKFSIFDLFRGKYNIQKAEINNSRLNLKFFEDGSDNYHFWKVPEKSSSSKINFELEDVEISTLLFSLKNSRQDIYTKFSVGDLNLSGNFAEKVFNLEAETDLIVNTFVSNEINYAKDRAVNGKFLLEIDNNNQKYTFREGKFNLEDLPLSINGYIQQFDSETTLSLNVAGSNMDINHLNSLLPENYKKNIGEYKAKGKLDINAKIEGNIGNATNSTIITADFNVNQGQFTEKESGVRMSEVFLEGTYQRLENGIDKISFEKLSANLGLGTFSGQGIIKDFKNPFLDFRLEGKLNLAEIRSFFRLDNFDLMEGEVTLDSHFKGKLQSNETITAEDLSNASTSGTFSVFNGKIKLKDHHQVYSQINGTILLNNNDAAIRELKGKIQNSDISLTGYFRNFFSYLFLKDQKLTIEANLVSDHINFNELLQEKEKSNPIDTNYRISLPENLVLNLNADIEKITFRKFTATSVNGKVKLANKKLNLTPFTFKTSGGSFESMIVLTEKSNGIFLTECNAQLRNIKIDQLFFEFENFGQTFLQDKNIRGLASADVVFKAEFTNRLQIKTEKVYSLIDIQIDEGKLMNLVAMKNISDYVKGNILISPMVNNKEFEKTLQNLQFSRLKNSIEIKDRKISIPTMDINSNSVDITISGEHYFDNRIDYKLDFRLSQLLTNRRINRSDFGEISDDGTGTRMFLAMGGTVENPEFSFDPESKRKHRKEELEQETQTVKSILKKEFGLFKKDSTLKDVEDIKTRENPKTTYDVEWGGEEKENEQPSDEEKSGPEKKGFLKKLFGKEEEENTNTEIYEEIEEGDDY